MAAWYREQLGVNAPEGHADFLWRDHERPEEIGRTVWSLFPDDTDYFGPSRPAFMIKTTAWPVWRRCSPGFAATA